MLFDQAVWSLFVELCVINLYQKLTCRVEFISMERDVNTIDRCCYFCVALLRFKTMCTTEREKGLEFHPGQARVEKSADCSHQRTSARDHTLGLLHWARGERESHNETTWHPAGFARPRFSSTMTIKGKRQLFIIVFRIFIAPEQNGILRNRFQMWFKSNSDNSTGTCKNVITTQRQSRVFCLLATAPHNHAFARLSSEKVSSNIRD
jgi:hypothetical protein